MVDGVEFADGLGELEDPKAALGEGFEELENGDVVVVLDGSQTGWDRRTSGDGFDRNLAEGMSASDRAVIGLDIVDSIKDDLESRKDWEDRAITALELLGVKDIADDGAFKGAAKVTHPAILTACMQFQSRAVEELFPSQGPVKSVVVGDKGEGREEQADRVSDFMNYQLTEMDDRYFWDVDQMLLYLPVDGSAFKKVYYDSQRKMTRAMLVRSRDMIVSYDANSLEEAERITHRYELTKSDVDRKIDLGEFVSDPALDTTGVSPEESDQKRMEDEADDRTPSRSEEDNVYRIYECHLNINPECASKFDPDADDYDYDLPYIATIEEDSGDILCIRRNWEEDDENRTKIIHFVHYKYLPGLGFYGFGLIHVIGSLGNAASGALRALLDGSATASLQGGFKSKEAKVSGDFIFSPGTWQDVDMAAEDLAKSFYTPPFKEPSPALFKTLELLVNGIEQFTNTTEAMTGQLDAKGAPVGSVLAMIEQGSKVFSAIHKRLHQAARKEFKLIARSNYLYMEDSYPYQVDGEDREVMREDFDERVDVIPVSDPNIFSSTQRIAMAQAVLELMSAAPDLYDEDARRKAHLNLMRAMKVPDPEEYLPERRTIRLDPVSENQAMLTGNPVEAFPEQDHQAHIQVHMNWLNEVQGLPMAPGMLQMVVSTIQAHMAEHYALAYRQRLERELGVPLPPFDQANFGENEDQPPPLDDAVARAVALRTQPVKPPPSKEEIEAQESASEQKRKDTETQADIARDDTKAQAEIRRKDALAQADMRRKQTDAAANLEGEMDRAGMLPSERDARRGSFGG